MKIAVEFPSVVYREGAGAAAKLARGIEAAGYDQIDIFDHVVMEHPAEGRARGPYPPTMPILEALMTLSYISAVTERVGLGTEVLVLPQRPPVLVAKQFQTLDTLSGGRVRVGVGMGWQKGEYEALGVAYRRRGKMLDEGIRLLRSCWRDAVIDFSGEFYRVEKIAMEPKGPTPGGPPIWIGGASGEAIRRVGTLGDGWLMMGVPWDEAKKKMASARQAAEQAGRNPAALGFQAALSTPPGADGGGRDFYAQPAQVAAAAGQAAQAGFGWVTLNATGVFLAGARSADAMVESLGRLHDAIHAEVG